MKKPPKESLCIRISPVLKAALKEAALKENRSVSNMVEVLIIDYYAVQSLDIPEKDRQN
jgi:hypothetical protein